MSELHVGSPASPDAGDGSRVTLDADHLTTHGVIVGMTGSGKTGLGVIAIEEALLAGVPTLVIDPKGDMANLCLRFPDFAPADFRPWIDEGQATRDGVDPDELAASTATRWREGVAGSGIDDDRMRRFADVPVTVYTPGSDHGVGLDLVGSLDVPAGADSAAMQDEATATVSGLLALVGVEADPLTSREHILLTNLITHAWQQGQALDMAALIGQVQQPPLRKLGVMEVDAFYPAKDRTALAMRLNGLMASPTFAAWARGVPLDVGAMLHTPEGSPRCAVVSLSHLEDDERQFVVTLLLSRVITWMRGLPGTSSLRALVYMDEVFGFVPPVKAPPSKLPILTILKQARAFGVGMVLSTQNPVDIDYKAISNAGTWMIGRLQTARDKDRLLEGMRTSSGAVDVDDLSTRISDLGKRQFVVHRTTGDAPTVFATRWAMSYMAGPMTGPQISALMAEQKAALAQAAPTPTAAIQPDPPPADPPGAAPVHKAPSDAVPLPAAVPAAPPAMGEDETALVPAVPDEVPQRHLDPAAPWAASVGAVAGGTRLVPHVAVRVQLRFTETKAGLDHVEEFEAVLPANADPADLSGLQAVDYDDRDLRTIGPDGARFALPEAKIATKGWWQAVERALKAELADERTLTLLTNPQLKLWSRPTETAEAFEIRCRAVADDLEDEEAARLRASFATKADRIHTAIARAQDRVAQLETDVSARRSSEMINIGSSILGGFLGGRTSARGVAADLRRAGNQRGQTQRTKARLDTAQSAVVDATDDLAVLEDELASDLLDIDHRWMLAAQEIDEVEIGLKRGGVEVDQLVLLWVPTAG